jgi:diguanylate cyclase (GGDEF)-like protein
MEPESGRAERNPLFLASAAFLAAGLVAALVVLINGDLADAGDDVLPLLFALAAITGLGGWYRQARAGDDRVARVEEERGRLEAELTERESSLRALERRLDEREAEHSRQKAELEKAVQEGEEAVRERESKLTTERGLRARLQHSHNVERDWTRELRSQVLQMHREQGALGHTGDVREMVLQVTLKLVEAEKGLLLSREDGDGDGELDVVCHLGFDGDPGESAVAQEFAGRVLSREETVREDSSSTLRAEKRTAADEEIHNLLAIPIFIQDDFHGVVVCANRDGGFEELDDDVLLALGDHAGAVLENGRLHGELRSSYMATVRMLSEAIEVKDPAVRLHSDEVANYVAAVANKLEIDPRRREELVIASLLHDVGKIGISERILLKPGALTAEERTTIELHPRIGFRLVEQVPALAPIAPAVLHHHERFDGDGYPAGLAGEQIPLEARVICVADSFSAMTSDRPYRAALDLEEACTELERCAGTQFDPQVVRLFVEAVRLCPPAREQPDGLAAVIDDPELRARRKDGEPVLGFGPVGLTDNLTFLYSHRYMHDAVRAHAERSAIQGRPFAVVLMELAALPEINASDGYAAGDAAIQEAARAVQRAASRSGGIACRHSGRRLALLAPETDAASAEALAREISLDLGESGPRVNTAVAAWEAGDVGDQVVARARLALAVQEVAPPRSV